LAKILVSVLFFSRILYTLQSSIVHMNCKAAFAAVVINIYLVYHPNENPNNNCHK